MCILYVHYLCAYVCMHMYICTNAYITTRINLCINVLCINMYNNLYINAYITANRCILMYTLMCVLVYFCINGCMYWCMHLHAYVSMLSKSVKMYSEIEFYCGSSVGQKHRDKTTWYTTHAQADLPSSLHKFNIFTTICTPNAEDDKLDV